jgi:ribonuclease J
MTDTPPVEVAFLGGLGAIGRNMATITIAGRIGIVDVGVLFPDSDHPGVDLILPDWSWLLERGDDVHAVFLTHGHLDHIGALPYLLRDLDRPLVVYGTALTVAFCDAILEEWPDLTRPEFRTIAPGDTIEDGPFNVEVIQVSHSIPDGVAFAFHTPHGLIVHTGDFKLDQQPLDGRPTDLAHFARLGDDGVDLLLADSTGAETPGHVEPERSIGDTLRHYMNDATGLVVVASFASHVHRIQQVLDAATAVGRRPVFVGRSMIRNMAIASDLGYLNYPMENAVDPRDVERFSRDELVVISTGSQGEPFSALSLMGSGDHRWLTVGEGDLVILASSLIPGNENAVFKAINNLSRRGAQVVHKGIGRVHVSGHASAEDLVLFHNIVEPEYVIPVHGEHRHLTAHARIATSTGCLAEHVLVCEDGDTVLLEDKHVYRGEGVPTSHVYIDGTSDDVGPALLRERRRIGEDGICVVTVTLDPKQFALSAPVVVLQKGVVYGEQAGELLAGIAETVSQLVNELAQSIRQDTDSLKQRIVQTVATQFNRETGRRPVVLPVIQHV